MADTGDRILTGWISRRRLLATASAAGAALGAGPAFAVTAPDLSFYKPHHVSVAVSDLKRSAMFYQKLFGFEPIQSLSPKGSNTYGFYFNKYLLSLTYAPKGKTGVITHLGIGVKNFDPAATAAALKARGVDKFTGSEAGSEYVFTPDPDKVNLQIIDELWATPCPTCDAPPGDAVQPTPKDAIFKPVKMHHFAFTISDIKRSAEYYKRVLGFGAPKPVAPAGSNTYAIDVGGQYLVMQVKPEQPGVITHFAVGVAGFDAKSAAEKLRKAGITDFVVADQGGANWVDIKEPDGATVRVIDAKYDFPCKGCAPAPT